MNYNFKIQNETIQQETEPVLYSGNVNIYSFTLDFDASWADFTKFAVFVKDGKTYTLPLTENTLLLPGEILAGEGVIRFGLYGTNGTDDLKRISSSMISIPVLRGAYTEGTAPAVPAPDIWEQYLAKVHETAKASAEDILADMDERVTALEKSSDNDTSITVDSELSAESENPVQNKAIFEALADKQDTDFIMTIQEDGVFDKTYEQIKAALTERKNIRIYEGESLFNPITVLSNESDITIYVTIGYYYAKYIFFADGTFSGESFEVVPNGT